MKWALQKQEKVEKKNGQKSTSPQQMVLWKSAEKNTCNSEIDIPAICLV